MNTPIITRAKLCISLVTSALGGFIAAGAAALFGVALARALVGTAAAAALSGSSTVRALFSIATLAALLLIDTAHAEWKVDFSRRSQQTRTQDLREPASSELPIDVAPNQQQAPGFFESLFQPTDIAQEIVVLNTDKGFVPSTIRVKKGMNYQIHIVNVNEKEKNVSFVLDSFSEHHATFFGKIKSFVIRPQKEGVFKFNSPETSAQGKLVVFPSDGKAENRAPASE